MLNLFVASFVNILFTVAYPYSDFNPMCICLDERDGLHVDGLNAITIFT